MMLPPTRSTYLLVTPSTSLPPIPPTMRHHRRIGLMLSVPRGRTPSLLVATTSHVACHPWLPVPHRATRPTPLLHIEGLQHRDRMRLRLREGMYPTQEGGVAEELSEAAVSCGSRTVLEGPNPQPAPRPLLKINIILRHMGPFKLTFVVGGCEHLPPPPL